MKLQILLFIFFLNLGGCATASRVPSDPVILLGEKPNFESMNSFQRIVQTTPGTVEFERARIDYLLERIGKSPYRFIRNGAEYSNARAIMHLRWKYLRLKKDVSNAEDFVKRIATGSKMTGREYQIQKKPNEIYPLNGILHHELNLLSEGMREHQEKFKEGPGEAKSLETSQIENTKLANLENQTIKKSGQAAEAIHNKQLV